MVHYTSFPQGNSGRAKKRVSHCFAPPPGALQKIHLHILSPPGSSGSIRSILPRGVGFLVCGSRFLPPPQCLHTHTSKPHLSAPVPTCVSRNPIFSSILPVGPDRKDECGANRTRLSRSVPWVFCRGGVGRRGVKEGKTKRGKEKGRVIGIVEMK